MVEVSISPEAGTLVLFESERFVHEVLPAVDNRYSIAGWFRKNASISGIVDPPR
ncbi:SM-20-related protein [Pseudoalteromonas sp. BSi20480]|nr:SM-20-related protein [Pseudoalteromonas sp. BSi20480]